MKTKQITQPTAYRNYTLVPRKDGTLDVVDPTTGRWANFPTQRYAKWSATLLTNLNARFGSNDPLVHIPQPQENP